MYKRVEKSKLTKHNTDTSLVVQSDPIVSTTDKAGKGKVLLCFGNSSCPCCLRDSDLVLQNPSLTTLFLSCEQTHSQTLVIRCCSYDAGSLRFLSRCHEHTYELRKVELRYLGILSPLSATTAPTTANKPDTHPQKTTVLRKVLFCRTSYTTVLLEHEETY